MKLFKLKGSNELFFAASPVKGRWITEQDNVLTYFDSIYALKDAQSFVVNGTYQETGWDELFRG